MSPGLRPILRQIHKTFGCQLSYISPIWRIYSALMQTVWRYYRLRSPCAGNEPLSKHFSPFTAVGTVSITHRKELFISAPYKDSNLPFDEEGKQLYLMSCLLCHQVASFDELHNDVDERPIIQCFVARWKFKEAHS
jgi:hypothetical protein